MIDYLTKQARTSWHQWFGEPLGRPIELHWVVTSNGGITYHDNVILFGFPSGQAQPALVAKVCRMPEYSWTLEMEFENLSTLYQILGDEARRFVPRPLALLKNNKDLALIVDFLAGRSLLFSSRTMLWNDIQAIKTRSIQAANLLRYLHGKTADANYPADEEKDGFHRKAALFRERFDLSYSERLEVDKLVTCVAACCTQAKKNVLLQGDFWHGNMIENEESRKLAIVDWQFSRWSTDASQDVYLYLLAGAVSAVPFAPPDKRAAAAARQLEIWSEDLIPAYLEAYGHPSEYALLPPREGILACTIEMATRPALAFDTHHPYDDILWRTLFTKLLDWNELMRLE